MTAFEHVVVAGCNGRFGRALARRLAGSAARLTGVDLDEAPADAGVLADYVAGSVERGDAPVLEVAARADCILLCVPETAVLGALAPLLGVARRDACIADIASVKTRIAARVAELGGAPGYLALHPMFAPSEPFAGRNLIAVPIRENAATARLEAVVRSWEARVTVLSAEEHDRVAACVQVIPHAALLAFGAALGAAGVDAETTERVATPVHETLTSLLARVLRGPDETYWSIQTDNPYAAEARARLLTALGEIDSIANRGEAGEFARFVEHIAGHFGAGLEELLAQSERIVEAARERDRDEPAQER